MGNTLILLSELALTYPPVSIRIRSYFPANGAKYLRGRRVSLDRLQVSRAMLEASDLQTDLQTNRTAQHGIGEDNTAPWDQKYRMR